MRVTYAYFTCTMYRISTHFSVSPKFIDVPIYSRAAGVLMFLVLWATVSIPIGLSPVIMRDILSRSHWLLRSR